MSKLLRIAIVGCLLFGCDDAEDVDAGPSRDGSASVDSGANDSGARDGGADPLDAASDAADDAQAPDAAPAATVTDTDYVADDDPTLSNPERGIYYWSVDDTDPHTLVAEWLYLGDQCAEDLTWAGHGDDATSPVLDAYADELLEHREAGRKVVFRPRYDTADDGGGLNDCGVFQADTGARMRAHVDAIAAMLADFVDVIAFVEAGYLGRWGEWNHAGHDPSTAPILVDPSERRAFLAYVLDAYEAAGVRRFVGLRRPVFAREIIDAEGPSRVGLYNDCFMTNSADYGTYSNFDDDNSSNFASAEDAKAWAIDLTATAPFGGETCPTGDETERWRMCELMVGASSEPGSLHMSYLHGGYALDARETWEDGGCYDEIRRRLGYRFEIAEVEYPPSATTAEGLTVTVALRNTGWSRLHNPRRAYVVLRSASAAYVVGGALEGYIELGGTIDGAAVEAWEPGEDATLTAAFEAPPPGTYALSLLVPDPDRPDIIAYAVALASRRDDAPLFDPVTGENELGVTVTIAP